MVFLNISNAVPVPTTPPIHSLTLPTPPQTRNWRRPRRGLGRPRLRGRPRPHPCRPAHPPPPTVPSPSRPDPPPWRPPPCSLPSPRPCCCSRHRPRHDRRCHQPSGAAAHSSLPSSTPSPATRPPHLAPAEPAAAAARHPPAAPVNPAAVLHPPAASENPAAASRRPPAPGNRKTCHRTPAAARFSPPPSPSLPATRDAPLALAKPATAGARHTPAAADNSAAARHPPPALRRRQRSRRTQNEGTRLEALARDRGNSLPGPGRGFLRGHSLRHDRGGL